MFAEYNVNSHDKHTPPKIKILLTETAKIIHLQEVD